VRRLLIISALSAAAAACSLNADRADRAYGACLSRHPQDAVICDGPRQAYDIDASILQARSGELR